MRAFAHTVPDLEQQLILRVVTKVTPAWWACPRIYQFFKIIKILSFSNFKIKWVPNTWGLESVTLVSKFLLVDSGDIEVQWSPVWIPRISLAQELLYILRTLIVNSLVNLLSHYAYPFKVQRWFPIFFGAFLCILMYNHWIQIVMLFLGSSPFCGCFHFHKNAIQVGSNWIGIIHMLWQDAFWCPHQNVSLAVLLSSTGPPPICNFF